MQCGFKFSLAIISSIVFDFINSLISFVKYCSSSLYMHKQIFQGFILFCTIELMTEGTYLNLAGYDVNETITLYLSGKISSVYSPISHFIMASFSFLYVLLFIKLIYFFLISLLKFVLAAIVRLLVCTLLLNTTVVYFLIFTKFSSLFCSSPSPAQTQGLYPPNFLNISFFIRIHPCLSYNRPLFLPKFIA